MAAGEREWVERVEEEAETPGGWGKGGTGNRGGTGPGQADER